MRGAMRYELPLWVLWALLVLPATADVIFRVPEVLVRHAAAPKAVGTGSIITRNDTRPDPRSVSIRQSGTARQEAVRANETDRDNWSGGLLEVRYEEYFVEHDVSTADARKAAKELNLANVPETHVGCGTCTRRELDYCETRLLADHCCCEQQFFPEPFPWLPHTCYMGADRCKPLVHDCARYARLRDCCCYKKLAERWKGILSSSTRMSVNGVSLLLLSMLLFVAYL